MNKKNIVTEENRMKDLFRKIETAKPSDDFTFQIMQRIASEKIVIEKKRKPFNWFPYIGSFILLFALVLIYLPVLTLWTDEFIHTVLPNYAEQTSVLWLQLYSYVASLSISPVVLIIIGSCSLLFTLFGITNAGQVLDERN